MASAQDVDVQMGNRLPAVHPVVDDQPESGFQKIEFPGDFLRSQEKGSQQKLIAIAGLREARDVLLRNDQGMDRGLGSDVVKGQKQAGFVDDFGGDLAVDDFFENRFHGERIGALRRRRHGPSTAS